METDPRIWAKWGGGLCTGFHEMGHVLTPNRWARWHPGIASDGGSPLGEGMVMLARQYALLRLGMLSRYREGVKRHAAAGQRVLRRSRPVTGAYGLVGLWLDLAWRAGNRRRCAGDGLERFFRLLERTPLYGTFKKDVFPAMQSCYLVSRMSEAYGADLPADFGRLGFHTTEAGRRVMANRLPALPSNQPPWRDVAETFVGCRRPDTLYVDVPDGSYAPTFCGGNQWADTPLRVSGGDGATLASAVILACEPCVRTFRAT